jgi:membrane dipeptidase
VTTTTTADADLDEIRELLATAPLVDGHNDLLWELRKVEYDFAALDVSGDVPALHTDIPRKRAARA